MIFNLFLVFSSACLFISVESLRLHQANMTDPLRLTILRAHNNYRSQLAKGLVTDVTNKTLPAGKNIYKLVSEMGEYRYISYSFLSSFISRRLNNKHLSKCQWV
uniref:Uncharacterized protein n=1 Tax=Meloidogyne enterolobii TaxID=390850 RepID=A0A6V7WQJ1_MELEN|nr:unnamed protein product [Meloidogyne enterolobii]